MAEGRRGRPHTRGAARARSVGIRVAVLALAAGLRLHDLGRADVWVDEANGILIASGALSDIPARLRFDSSPPLYYGLLHVWKALAGDGAAALRLLSVAFGVALAGAAWAVGARLPIRGAGLFSALAVATSPVHVFHSQQVRMYTLLGLLALLSVWLLVRFLRGGRTRDLALFVATTAAALYTHNFALHLGVVHVALVLLSGTALRRLPRLGLAAAALVALYAPWLPTLLHQLENPDHYAWYLPLWNGYGPLGAAWRTLLSFSPAGEFVMFDHGGAPSWHALPAVLGAGTAAFGAWALWRRRAPGDRPEAVWLPAYLALPIASALLLSSFLAPHYVPGRVDQLVYPAYALLLGAGIAALPARGLRAASGVALVGFGVAMHSAYATDAVARGFDGSDRALAAAVAEVLRPGDVILCTGLTRAPLAYELGRRGIDAPILSFPRETALHLGSQNDWRLVRDPGFLRAEAERVLDRARGLAAPGGRLFVLRSNQPTNDGLAPGPLRGRHGLESEGRLGRYVQAGTPEVIEVTLYRFPRGK